MIKGQQPAAKSGLPLRKKILYYGLMLLLILLVLEGMASRAYYAAYGQEYGGGRLDPPASSALPHDSTNFIEPRHPYYGFTGRLPDHALNAMPPRQRREDLVVVGLLGGSVAADVNPFFQDALNRYFAANRLPRQPVVIGLASGALKQPQQTMILVNALLLGGEFDLIVNLDGVNEVINSGGLNYRDSIFPFFPLWWDKRVGLTREEVSLAGQIGVLRREQARLTALRDTPILRWSALFGLVNRWRQERIAAEIIQRNRQLAAAAADYKLEKHGPGNWPARGELFPAAARVWYRGSLALSRLAAVAGADYYHFLQPSQYVPAAKPLSSEERALAYAPDGINGSAAIEGYPLLRQYNQDLPGQGIHYFDLNGIFVDHPETLYIDDCCHLNERGNELLAAAMVRRLEPALLPLGGESPAGPVSDLAAARLPAGPAPPAGPAAAPGFRVSLSDDGKELRYVREGCAPGDTEPAFFLRLIPRDAVDQPPRSQTYGFDNRNFSFQSAGGRFARGQCAAQIRLPDYPLAALLTGQYVLGTDALLWSVELIAPADPDQLRADYAALAAEQPVAQDFFDLYALDNRLIYLRETCAAADTAAEFFLHIFPEEAAHLPEERRAAGFVHGVFDFAHRGGHFDGKCLAAVVLPDYPIKEIRAGAAHIGQRPLWLAELIAAPDYDQLRADYSALFAEQPAARNYFDLYALDNRLLYRREACAAGDTAAEFFLHIVPEDPADLPADRQDAGFAHGGFDFVRQGGHFDGKCLASVPLPDYPIKEMRTGQHIPGQGDLWSATIAAP